MVDIERVQALHRFVTHNRDEARHLRLGMAAYLLDVAKLELEKCLPSPQAQIVTTPDTPPSEASSTEPVHHGS